ncbi:MAG: hypothetical protein WAO00_13395, partial [Chthoniobacterales bacterium]
QEPDHLICTFLVKRKEFGAPLVIEGHLNKYGEFAANVSLEVGDQENGNWKQIESSFSKEPDLKLSVAPHLPNLLTRVQVDALQPYIGKFKFCRVVLQTGESEVVPMEWLTEKGGD